MKFIELLNEVMPQRDRDGIRGLDREMSRAGIAPKIRCSSMSNAHVFRVKNSSGLARRSTVATRFAQRFYMPKAIDLTGLVFGRLTVLGLAGTRRVGRGQESRRYYRVRCECGVEKEASAPLLRSGQAKSCGCLGRENRLAATTVHGHARGDGHSAEYDVWSWMIGRCHNPTNPAFPNYGGRGIEVCDRWRDSFELFLEDMGARPSDDHSIDRRDNARGYEPGNCWWATRFEQSRNKRCNRFLEIGGRTLTQTDWAALSGVPLLTLRNRLKRGWTPCEAVFTPSEPSVPNKPRTSTPPLFPENAMDIVREYARERSRRRREREEQQQQ